jgi:hypothetical protein
MIMSLTIAAAIVEPPCQRHTEIEGPPTLYPVSKYNLMIVQCTYLLARLALGVIGPPPSLYQHRIRLSQVLVLLRPLCPLLCSVLRRAYFQAR